MTNINWSELVDATEDNKRSADMIIRTDDGKERLAPYNGGWIYLHDATHTVDNKQSITADTLTHLTIDGQAADSTTDFRRGIGLDIFGNSTLQPFATGETYNINLTFRASKATSTDTFVEVDVGIGSDYSTIIARDRRALTKGSGIEDFVFFNGSLFVTAPFSRYGARFFLNASENVSIWDKAIFLQRTHSP
jgi:hypothetical protein